MFDAKKIREDFPILKRKIGNKPLVYLDNAATSQRPKQVIGAISNYYEKHNANVHRGIHTLSEESTKMYMQSRRIIAEFIGAGDDELIFVRNATEGINLVAWAWAYNKISDGEEILTTEMEHHSNFVPWLQLSGLGKIKVRYVHVHGNGLLDMKDFEKKLSKRTKLVAVVHCSNVTGVINPIKEIIKKARRVGAKVLIDAAQSVQHVGVDVGKLGCDFLVFSGHKMLGPMGIGGVFINKERMEEMGPFLTGGGMISEVSKEKVTWARGVGKFEAGTPDVAGAVGLAAAVEYHRELGMNKIRKYERKLTSYALKSLSGIKGIKIVGTLDDKKRVGVISFILEGVHAHDIAQILDYKMGVAVRSGHHCAMPLHSRLGLAATTRASFYIYNQRSDVDKLVEGIEKVKMIFKRN